MNVKDVPIGIWNMIQKLFNDFLRGGNTWRESVFVYFLFLFAIVLIYPNFSLDLVFKNTHGILLFITFVLVTILLFMNLYNIFLRGFVESKIIKRKVLLTDRKARYKVGSAGIFRSFSTDINVISKDNSPVEFGTRLINKRQQSILDSTFIVNDNDGSMGIGFYKQGGGRDIDWTEFNLKEKFHITMVNDNGFVTVTIIQGDKRETFSGTSEKDLTGQLYVWTRSMGEFKIEFSNMVLNQEIYTD
ncbi:MAG TPA: hypothetical protein PLD77_01320 [Candidatus Dojkabacteria bacterium]|nr:hypothetical protein [Candidatus Dojkabacteria bacterium]